MTDRTALIVSLEGHKTVFDYTETFDHIHIARKDNTYKADFWFNEDGSFQNYKIEKC